MPAGSRFLLQFAETNKTTAAITFPQTNRQTVDTITSTIGGKLSNLTVTKTNDPNSFVITTSQINKALVKNVLSTDFADAEISEPELDEVVNNAILTAFADELQIQQNLQPKIASQVILTPPR